MNFRISTVAAIARVDEQSIVDAAKLFGYRRVGPFLCVSRPLPPPFFEEVLHLQKMRDAARRRAALARWQEAYERIAAVRPRCEGERQAQVQALVLMERARPG